MTTEHEASRTLVKSPPELWAECSDAGSLTRHLREFGEIKVTRLEPETTVAWEGEHASGTVQIEPSGWGTRVTLTAQTKAEAPETPPQAEAIQGPGEEARPQAIETEIHTDQEESDETATDTLEDADPVPSAGAPPARGRWRRLTARMRGLFREGEPAAAQNPEAIEEPAGEVAAEAVLDELPHPDPEPAEAPSAEPIPEAEQPAAEPQLDAEAILAFALDSLGQAHHRPFSRA